MQRRLDLLLLTEADQVRTYSNSIYKDQTRVTQKQGTILYLNLSSKYKNITKMKSRILLF
jgi:hypothetical protein